MQRLGALRCAVASSRSASNSRIQAPFVRMRTHGSHYRTDATRTAAVTRCYIVRDALGPHGMQGAITFDSQLSVRAEPPARRRRLATGSRNMRRVSYMDGVTNDLR